MNGVLLITLALAGASASDRDDSLLAGAEARIREHRTREVRIRPTDADGRPLAAGTIVEYEQTRHAFLFGCNIYAFGKLDPTLEEAYRRRFAALFNFATLPFYWWSYERQPGTPDYAATDRILRWCREHGVTPKGHPLAWNYVDPPWMSAAGLDPAEAMARQLERIGACARRFRGAIGIWDVVNEATQYEREALRKRAPVLTGAIDAAGVGDYVRRAFRAARAASPAATLIINDYRLDPRFETRVIAELVDEDGKALYDVIGLQSHQHGGAKPLSELWEVCERYAKHGRPLHWTETTFVSGEEGWDLAKRRPDFRWTSTPDGERRQARDTERFYTLLFSHPAVEAITWWDFSDRRAWQQAPAGLLREDMTPKPAYEALERLVRGRWWTRGRTSVDAGGHARWRGFLGRYRVKVRAGDRTLEGEVELSRDDPERPRDVRLAPVGPPSG